MVTRTLILVSALLTFLVSGCGPEPTPFAVTPIVLNTPDTGTAEPTWTPIPPLRYGVLPNAANYAPIDAFNNRFAQAEIMTDLDTQFGQFDVVSGYGRYEGWQESPVLTTVSLAFNTTLPPLNSPEIADTIASAIRPQDVIASMDIPGIAPLTVTETDTRAVREALANNGYPDGFTIYISNVSLPGAGAIISQLREVNVEVMPLENVTNSPQLQLVTWKNEAERATLIETYGEENVLDLYPLPISYRVPENVVTSFTDDGWLIVAR